jgi:hypothetical protein
MNNSSLIRQYNNSLNYPEMEQLHSKTSGILTIISDIQEKMVQESEGQTGKPALSALLITQTETGQKILYDKLSKPFDLRPAKDFLVPGCSARKKLDISMAEYVIFIKGIMPAENVLNHKNIIEADTFLPAGNIDISKMSLMSALHSLEVIKNGILAVESPVLNEIGKQK